MVRKITNIATKCLNWFPAKGGVSPYYSPHVIMHVTPPDYENHFQILFGAYVQVSYEPQPSNTPFGRTIYTIYLEPMGNKQEGHILMNLNTGEEVPQHGKITELPVNYVVTKAVVCMASR